MSIWSFNVELLVNVTACGAVVGGERVDCFCLRLPLGPRWPNKTSAGLIPWLAVPSCVSFVVSLQTSRVTYFSAVASLKLLYYLTDRLSRSFPSGC